MPRTSYALKTFGSSTSGMLRNPSRGRGGEGGFAAGPMLAPAAPGRRERLPGRGGASGRVRRIGTVERKLATVLFVDLVDSTRLVTGMDPEVVRRRVSQFFERVLHEI